MNDREWMLRALTLAEHGRGAVEPNPLVGAVIVRDGTIVGEGWHQRYGGPHAEIHALAQAGTAAQATLYVNLEPCCHHGKTPPCTDAVLRAGIRRVVAAMADPFPQVAGRGAELLRRAGVEVEIGLCETEARRLNAPYLHLMNTKRPYVHLKWAMSLDGKIATRSGNSKWISNEASRRRVHALRGRVDGILVGIGTALADDPQLTARPAGARVATRIVLDSEARLPLESQLVRTARQVPTLIATTQQASQEKCDRLAEQGCEILLIGEDRTQRQENLLNLMNELGRRRWTNVLIEGGGEVLGSCLDAGVADEVHVFIAPLLVGGEAARAPILGRGCDQIAQSLRLRDLSVEMIDDNIYLHGVR